MHDEILSTLKKAPTSRFVYSSLSFHGSRHAGELPGTWFVRALGALGVEEHSVRQALYRMERDGALATRSEGRTKVYRATATTRAIIAGGTAKMMGEPEPPWDGDWTIVHFQFDGRTRHERERFRDVLRVEGFGHLGPGIYVHPRDRSRRIREAVADWDVDGRLHLFRGRRVQGEPASELRGELDDRAFAASVWDLEGIADRYAEFLARFAALRRRRAWPSREAAATRFALVFAFLEIAWDDPGLAPELLPARWPGDRARALIRELYERLTAPALEFGESLLRAR